MAHYRQARFKWIKTIVNIVTHRRSNFDFDLSECFSRWFLRLDFDLVRIWQIGQRKNSWNIRFLSSFARSKSDFEEWDNSQCSSNAEKLSKEVLEHKELKQGEKFVLFINVTFEKFEIFNPWQKIVWSTLDLKSVGDVLFGSFVISFLSVSDWGALGFRIRTLAIRPLSPCLTFTWSRIWFLSVKVQPHSFVGSSDDTGVLHIQPWMNFYSLKSWFYAIVKLIKKHLAQSIKPCTHSTDGLLIVSFFCRSFFNFPFLSPFFVDGVSFLDGPT